MSTTRDQTISIGGPEYLSLNEILRLVMEATGLRRKLVHIAPPYLRAMTVLFESFLPGLPVSVFWLDYLAVNRTCALDTLPRSFNLMPARFHQQPGSPARAELAHATAAAHPPPEVMRWQSRSM